MNTKFIARLNWNGRKGWAVVKREGSRKTGFTETLALDFIGSQATARAMAYNMQNEFDRDSVASQVRVRIFREGGRIVVTRSDGVKRSYARNAGSGCCTWFSRNGTSGPMMEVLSSGWLGELAFPNDRLFAEYLGQQQSNLGYAVEIDIPVDISKPAMLPGRPLPRVGA